MKKGLKRDTTDKFYTKNNIVIECINNINKYISIKDDDIIIEPSAGNGAFLLELKKQYPNNKILAFDIKPDIEEIKVLDFLKFDYEPIKDNTIHIIGNPPFGRQSSTCKKFIKYCCSFATTISFILPKSFKKDSCKKIFLLDFHLKLSIDLDDDAFTLDDKDHNVPSIFQIWKKESTERLVVKDEISKYISFVKKEDKPDLSIRRVGVNTTKCDKEIDDKSVQSHYFVKVKEDIDIDSFLEKFNKLNFNDKDNTVGPKSISKPELIKTVNTIQF